MGLDYPAAHGREGFETLDRIVFLWREGIVFVEGWVDCESLSVLHPSTSTRAHALGSVAVQRGRCRHGAHGPPLDCQPAERLALASTMWQKLRSNRSEPWLLRVLLTPWAPAPQPGRRESLCDKDQVIADQPPAGLTTPVSSPARPAEQLS